MSRLNQALLCLLAITCIFSSSAALSAQPDPTRITTVDGVRLNVVFYPSTKKNAATVIMLHPIGVGKSIKSQEWKALAATLQKNNYAVAMFDFRGHGDSTTIDAPDVFWNVPANRAAFAKARDKESIDVKDFYKNNAYIPVLINDIAAVKAFLDRKNDEGACNTGNTIVIGAENGGTLGTIWINSEWYRHKFNPPNLMLMQPGGLEKKSEGDNIIAGIFLSISPKLNGTRGVNVSSVLAKACKTQAMPAIFFSGKDDAKARDFAKTLETRLKVKGSKRHDYIGAVPLPTALSGFKLLQKSLGTDKAIVDWLDGVVLERGNEYYKRDFQDSLYVWRNPFNGQPIPAKALKGEKHLKFDTYERFITQ